MKRAFSIFLLFVMFITHMGMTVATHFCGGKAVKTTLSWGQAELGCGMMTSPSTCTRSSDYSSIRGTACCENKYAQLSIEDDYRFPSVVSTALNYQFAAVFISTYLDLYHEPSVRKSKYQNYIPPLLAHDIPVLIQSFLI